MNNGVAACGFTFDPSDYYRQAITNMDGRPKLTFTSCRCAAHFPTQHLWQLLENGAHEGAMMVSLGLSVLHHWSCLVTEDSAGHVSKASEIVPWQNRTSSSERVCAPTDFCEPGKQEPGVIFTPQHATVHAGVSKYYCSAQPKLRGK